MLLTAFSVYYRGCPSPMYISMSRNPCKFKTLFRMRKITLYSNIGPILHEFYTLCRHYIAPFPMLLQLKDGGSMAFTELR